MLFLPREVGEQIGCAHSPKEVFGIDSDVTILRHDTCSKGSTMCQVYVELTSRVRKEVRLLSKGTSSEAKCLRCYIGDVAGKVTKQPMRGDHFLSSLIGDQATCPTPLIIIELLPPSFECIG